MRPALTNPSLIELYTYWESKRSGEAIPLRADMHPGELARWKENLLLIGVGDGQYRYRLYGHAFVDEFGVEMRGRTIDDLPAEQRDLLKAEYEGVARSRAPASRVYTALFPLFPDEPTDPARREMTWERLVLPLSENGQDLSALLVAAYPLELD